MMAGALEGVLFDLDGTLADTLEDIAGALNGVLEARGLPGHDLAACRAMVGWGMRSLVSAALPVGRREEGLVGELTEAMLAAYGARPLVHSRPYPGMAEALAELRRRGIPAAVLSNKPHALTVRIVEGLFPGHAFVDIRGDRPGLPRKPDPAGALALCAGMGLDPWRVLFLGDSEVDLETARRAGMPCAGALWGFRGREALGGADFLLENPEELAGLLRN